MIADRFFAAQRVLGVLHLLGAGFLYYITTVTNPDGFYWAVLVYSLAYAPTLALANSVAFRQMNDPGKEFASIRFLGTIGSHFAVAIGSPRERIALPIIKVHGFQQLRQIVGAHV